MHTPAALIAGRVIGALCMIVGVTGAASGQAVTLQYQWSKGEVIRYRFVQEGTTNISGLPGGVGTMDVHVTMSQVLCTTVEDVTADGIATLSYLYESARFEMKSPMGVIVYDSESKDAPAAGAIPETLGRSMSALIGESFVVVMTRLGRVEKVEGMDRVFDKMFKSLPPDPSLTQMVQSIKSSFSDDALRGIFGQSHAMFPDRPLSSGDSWEDQTTVTNPLTGAQTVTSTFTLQTIEDSAGSRVARIATTLTIKPDPGAAPIAPIGLKMQPGDSSGDGEFTFDIARGRLNRSTIRTTTPLEMTVPRADGSTMNMKTVVKNAFMPSSPPSP